MEYDSSHAHDSMIEEPLKIIDAIVINSGIQEERDVHHTAAMIDILKEIGQKLNLTNSYYKISSLNATSFVELKMNCLVRFRCMIQDIKEPEMIPRFINVDGKIINCLFKEIVEWPCDIDEYELSRISVTRHVFKCVPIPGETDWIKQKWLTMDKISQVDLENNKSIESVNDNNNNNNNGPLNSSTTLDSCFVKIYAESDSFKLNDCVEFIGIWQCVSDIEGNNRYSLHSITSHILQSNQITVNLNAQLTAEKCTEIRPHLVEYLSSSLNNDKLAAQYLMCNLISSCIHNEITCVGKFSLNLYGISQNKSKTFVSSLLRSLELIVCKVQYLPLKLELLNNERLIPYKDYDKEMLCTSKLQLSNGTLLIIDETQLEIGQLNELGVGNVSALKVLVNQQKLHYDFTYHDVEFKTDLNILIISEGPSFLSCDFALPIIEEVENVATTFEYDDVKKWNLNLFRTFLIEMRKSDLEIDDNMQETIRNDFVKMRKDDANIGESKLHQLLVLSRWLTRSNGQVNMKREHWNEAIDLENKRNSRKPVV